MITWEETKKSITSISDDEKVCLEFMARIVGKVVDRRVELGWTQEELAERSNLKQPAIARFESASVIPNLATLIKICSALGLDIQVK
ncbi:helix-turn-helix transcriptional regulator [Paenibacillus alvei]|uniref:helix-turn-helix domain-containing protein n=1 Tax=Paenibacillus alvei TaxID=44250 RepID=UPI00227FCA95|nr:helix-turn-helix transcriptional regulator [Paenibacillus alvei]MCY9738137.1 helix-turn-helix transcriptional regulator [Paenibacillus alvei]